MTPLPGLPRVAFVGPPGLLDRGSALLAEQDVTVARFADAAALGLDHSVLGSIEVLAAGSAIPDALVERAPRLRALVSPWTGTDMFDVAAARARGLEIANGQVAENVISMAEAVVMLMLSTAYDLAGARAALDQPRLPIPRARMLYGLSVGLVGYGAIARAVAERLDGWGVQLLVNHRGGDRPLPGSAARAELDDLLARSDIVSLHLALTPETRHLIDERRLRSLKPDAILINSARGALIEEAALAVVAAERGDLKFALDVFEVEPLPLDSPLRGLANVALTPHSVGHTRDTINRLPRALAENVLRLLSA